MRLLILDQMPEAEWECKKLRKVGCILMKQPRYTDLLEQTQVEKQMKTQS